MPTKNDLYNLLTSRGIYLEVALDGPISRDVKISNLVDDILLHTLSVEGIVKMVNEEGNIVGFTTLNNAEPGKPHGTMTK